MGRGTEWMAQGACREYPPEVFFPADSLGVDAARAICAGCPVREPCLEYALENRVEHGVWGGTSERARVRIARQRRAAAAASRPTATTSTPPA
jgi:WhiB family redox-sensing transcriptional regulator